MTVMELKHFRTKKEQQILQTKMIQTLWGTEQPVQKEIDQKWHNKFKLQKGVEFIRHEFTNRKDFIAELDDFVGAGCWAMYMDGQCIFDTLEKEEQQKKRKKRYN